MTLSNTRKNFIILMTALGAIALATIPETIAQEKPKPIPPASTLPDNNSSFTGNVESYLLNREGLVDGLLLDEGIQAKFPPHLSDRLVEIAPIGSQVSLQGTPGMPTNFGQAVKAESITNVETGEKIVEQPPLEKKQPDGDRESNMTAEGNVEHWLVGHRGEINGMILSSGTQIKFPPHVGERLAAMAQDDREIEAEGFGVENDYGKLIEASSLRVDGQMLDLSREGLGKKP
jgi:hypothetical protein